MITIKLSNIVIEKKDLDDEEEYYVISGEIDPAFEDYPFYVPHERYFCYKANFTEMDSSGESWQELVDNWEKIKQAEVSYVSDDEYATNEVDRSKKAVIAIEILKTK